MCTVAAAIQVYIKITVAYSCTPVALCHCAVTTGVAPIPKRVSFALSCPGPTAHSPHNRRPS
jgi:hypothetical protein